MGTVPVVPMFASADVSARAAAARAAAARAAAARAAAGVAAAGTASEYLGFFLSRRSCDRRSPAMRARSARLSAWLSGMSGGNTVRCTSSSAAQETRSELLLSSRTTDAGSHIRRDARDEITYERHNLHHPTPSTGMTGSELCFKKTTRSETPNIAAASSRYDVLSA